MDQPKLRPIEAFPVNVGGRDVIRLRDPTDLTGKTMLVPHEAMFILAHFDGKHSILAIQEAYTRQYGQLLLSDVIKAFMAKLDEHLLLDSEHFRANKQQLIEAFQKSSVPPAAHVGTAYAADPIALDTQLAGYFADSAEPRMAAAMPSTGSVQGILSPHIDPRREGSFRSIAEYQDRRRICGFPPTYMLFSTMPAMAGTVLKYDQAVEPATQSMVSYASVVFH